MKAGGFDAVVGNPPYVRQETLGQEFKEYVGARYETFSGTADLYVYFIEKSHSLLRPGGYFGMICSNKFMRANYGQNLRQYLATQTSLRRIVDFGELPVFQNAATFPAIVLTENKKTKKQRFSYAPVKRLDFLSLEDEARKAGMELDDRSLSGSNWTLARGEEVAIIEKMKAVGTPLGEYVENKIFYGIKTGLNKAFVIDKETRARLIKEDAKSKELIKPFAVGDDVRKYRIDFRERYLILVPKGQTNMNKKGDAWGWFKKTFPAVADHLLPFKEAAQKRDDQGDYWWELRACDYYKEFERPKIIYPDIAKESRMTFDSGGLYLGNTAYFIPSDDLYLLGLINSKLIFAYFKRTAAVLGDADKGGRLRWFRQDVIQLPIRRIDFADRRDKARHGRVVELAGRMLDLNGKLASARTAHDKTVLQRQIAATDGEIDRLVYELYGLTAEEIAIVEGN
ncbi:MAG: Eco57I restriction-modification methylase domain-containing protein [Nitrospinae bacterium]|nr:Eco57I restriction-modification methylase domain-containing protein [Nitrospinota bacterium]